MDSNQRIADLRSTPLSHLGTRPSEHHRLRQAAKMMSTLGRKKNAIPEAFCALIAAGAYTIVGSRNCRLYRSEHYSIVVCHCGGNQFKCQRFTKDLERIDQEFCKAVRAVGMWRAVLSRRCVDGYLRFCRPYRCF